MMKYCLQKWDQNKDLLEEKLKTDTTLNSCDYAYLVKLVVDFILNKGESENGLGRLDSGNITIVDSGDYNGTLLFLIPFNTYCPAEYEYLMTYVDYGSCSGCDTLIAIQGFGDGLLTYKQVGEFMVLCKDLLTNMIRPYNRGWRHNELFDEVEVK